MRSRSLPSPLLWRVCALGRQCVSLLALLAALQRLPVVPVLERLASGLLPRFAVLARATAAAASGLGLTHAVVGQTPVLSYGPGTAATMEARVGLPFQAIILRSASPYQIEAYTLSPAVPGLTIRLITGQSAQIFGTPTTPGTYRATVRAWRFASLTGDSTSIPLTVTVGTSSTLPPLIVTPPASRTVTAGDAVTFSVVATSDPAPTYQWRFNGGDVAGATGPTLTVPFAQGYQAGEYQVVVSNPAGSVVSPIATLTINPPEFTAATRLVNLATRARVGTGAEVAITGFVVQGLGRKRFLLRGVGPELGVFGVPGVLVDPRLELFDAAGRPVAANDDWGTPAGAANGLAAAALAAGAFPFTPGGRDAALLLELDPGLYTAQLSGAAGGTGVGLIELYDLDPVDGAAPAGRLVNLSSRAWVGTGADVVIPGVVVVGPGRRTLLFRAVGPTLGSFGVAGVLADPRLTVVAAGPPSTEVAANDDWSDAPNGLLIAESAARLGAFPLALGSRDAAVLVTLPAGAYTAQVAGANGATGVVLVEVYEVD